MLLAGASRLRSSCAALEIDASAGPQRVRDAAHEVVAELVVGLQLLGLRLGRPPRRLLELQQALLLAGPVTPLGGVAEQPQTPQAVIGSFDRDGFGVHHPPVAELQLGVPGAGCRPVIRRGQRRGLRQ